MAGQTWIASNGWSNEHCLLLGRVQPDFIGEVLWPGQGSQAASIQLEVSQGRGLGLVGRELLISPVVAGHADGSATRAPATLPTLVTVFVKATTNKVYAAPSQISGPETCGLGKSTETSSWTSGPGSFDGPGPAGAQPEASQHARHSLGRPGVTVG